MNDGHDSLGGNLLGLPGPGRGGQADDPEAVEAVARINSAAKSLGPAAGQRALFAEIARSLRQSDALRDGATGSRV